MTGFVSHHHRAHQSSSLSSLWTCASFTAGLSAGTATLTVLPVQVGYTHFVVSFQYSWGITYCLAGQMVARRSYEPLLSHVFNAMCCGTDSHIDPFPHDITRDLCLTIVLISHRHFNHLGLRILHTGLIHGHSYLYGVACSDGYTHIVVSFPYK